MSMWILAIVTAISAQRRGADVASRGKNSTAPMKDDQRYRSNESLWTWSTPPTPTHPRLTPAFGGASLQASRGWDISANLHSCWITWTPSPLHTLWKVRLNEAISYSVFRCPVTPWIKKNWPKYVVQEVSDVGGYRKTLKKNLKKNR